MKIGLFLFLSLWVFSGPLSAQTLLVSDVDDTIKLAHVMSYRDSAYYAFDDKSRFMGMSELYQALVKANPDLQVVYLSRAPTWLMSKRHQRFLKNGLFPPGRYIGRSKLSSDVHKLESLRQVINEVRPRKVVLIGDNGEKDAEVYQQVANEYRSQGIEFVQFIRVVYTRSLWSPLGEILQSAQVGFVTPFEVALELERARLLTVPLVEDLFKNILPPFLNEKPDQKNIVQAFPYFVNCQSFVWRWDDRLGEFAGLNEIKKRIVKRCGLMP